MRLFDEHIILRLFLIFSCIFFSIFIPDIINTSDSVIFILYFIAIFLLAVIALFYKTPTKKISLKIRSDIEIPEKVENLSVRDYEKDISERDELFQMLVDVSSVGFWTYDVPTGKAYWSNRVAKFLNISISSIVDNFDTLKNSVLESDWTFFKENLSKALETKRSFEVVLRLLKASDEENSEIVVSGRLQYDKNSNPIRIIGSITTAKAKNEDNRKFYAYRDVLTGVYNRKFFLDKLKVDVEMSAQNPHYAFAVVLLDIDSFGAINESYSINFGDSVLKIVSERICSSCGENDCVARIGPDVFAVVLHNIDVNENEILVSKVKRIHNQVKNSIQIEGREIFISVSMAVVINKEVDCVEDILSNATALLRDLKKSGNHGGIQFFSGGIREKAMKLYKLEYEIRRAVQNREFVLVYQPIVDIEQNNCVIGFEALVRWNNSERGIVTPAEFIPLAEETGLIVPMGLQILKMACEQTKKWVDLGYSDIKVSVNFSAKQFVLDTMVEDVKRVLSETRLNPKNLKLEITEYTAMYEVEKSIEIMKKLSSMGIQISIDDFGTGYSSLQYLKRYPVQTLKMDKSFIEHIADDEEDATFARMVIGISKTLNLNLIAEGVETYQQLQFLKREGCRYIQGYYFSKPLNPDFAFKYMEKYYSKS